MKVFASPDHRRLQRKSECRPAGPAPSLLGRQRRAIREILDGPGRDDGRATPATRRGQPGSGELQARLRVHSPGFTSEQVVDPRGETSVAIPGRQACGKRVVQNLDQEEVRRRATRKRIHEREPGRGIEHPEGPEGHPARVPTPRSCRYRTITVSHQDAWQDYPASSGGGRAGGAFVSPNADWVAGAGIMKERFVVTIDVDGDPNLCRYQQENQNRVVRREGTAGEVVDRDRPRHDDTYPAGSSWIRFVGSQIQWMDAPGYAASLDDTDPPVHQQWTFWWSAWDSDGTGPLVIQLSYDFKADGAGTPWSISYDPGVPNSASR